MDGGPESLPDPLRERAVGELPFRGAELLDELKDLATDLAGALGSRTKVDEGKDPALVESPLRLVDGGTGDAEVLGGSGDPVMVGDDAPDHLVADLEEIPCVEEGSGVEERVRDPLGMGMSRSALAEAFELVWVSARHEPPPGT